MSQQSQESEPTEPPKIPPGTLAHAEEVIGLAFTDSERLLMADDVDEQRQHYGKIRAVPLENSTMPAFHFDPRPIGATFSRERKPIIASQVELPSPFSTDIEDIAFWPVTL